MSRALFLWRPMLLGSLIAGLLLAGCGAGKGATAPTAGAMEAETEWVLIQNPRFSDRGNGSEYVWVERDKIPKTLTSTLFGEKAVLAPPEAYAKAGPPPGPGRIWRPPEGGTASPPPASPTRGGTPPTSSPPEAGAPAAATPLRPEDRRGYVVLVDGMRVVIDLADGEIKKDALIAITRRQALTHPVTGEHLGEINLEIGRARVVEIQPKFSVAELIGFKPGLTVKPQDRVTVLPGSP